MTWRDEVQSPEWWVYLVSGLGVVGTVLVVVGRVFGLRVLHSIGIVLIVPMLLAAAVMAVAGVLLVLQAVRR